MTYRHLVACTRRASVRASFAFVAAAAAAQGAEGQDSTRASGSRGSADSAAAREASAASPATRARARTTRPARPEPVWPVPGPAPLPGSILPGKRIVAYYGNPLSRRMGILGELPPKQMLERLDREVAAWNRADPATPVQPALHLVTVVAQASAGADGKYRARMKDTLIERVASWAETRAALVFLDIQVARSTLKDELPAFEEFLRRPNFHLAIDPEFSMKRRGQRPGRNMGTMSAEDVNHAISFLADLVTKHNLPPKILIVHRFTRHMLTGADEIRLDPRVQVVIHMDGWGPPSRKKHSYREYVYAEPVQFTGFKVFYKNDTKGGGRVMTPAEILELHPKPVYVQYQ